MSKNEIKKTLESYKLNLIELEHVLFWIWRETKNWRSNVKGWKM